MTNEPASPINILAGGKLNIKKPNSVPTRRIAIAPTKTCSLNAAAKNKIEAAIDAGDGYYLVSFTRTEDPVASLNKFATEILPSFK